MKKSINQHINRKITALSVVAVGAMLNLAFQNCAPSITKFSMSSQTVLEKANILSNPGTEVVQNMCKNLIQQYELTDCSKPVTLANGTTMDRKEWERQTVMAQVANDPTLVPAFFAYSFGKAMDNVAEGAHSRAILSNNRDMFVDSAGKDFTTVPAGLYSYYKGDHSLAKQQYISGQRCFYSTIKIDPTQKIGSGYFDIFNGSRFDVPVPTASNWPLRHVLHYMTVGYCAGDCADNTSRYGAGSYGKDYYPNRLLSGVANSLQPIFQNGVQTVNSEKQVVKLFVNDFRNAQFKLSSATSDIIKIQEGVVRGYESSMAVTDMVDLLTVMANYNDAVTNLSSNFIDPTTQINFSGISGAKQALANLCTSAISGTTLSTQYTPIALPLRPSTNLDKSPAIITTSASDGVKFDMVGNGIKTQTAWLGGELNKILDITKEGKPFQHVISDEVKDGFLVIPNADGSISGIKNLFGSNTEVHGKKYTNGFEALMALTGKDCRSTDIKSQYFGPWDGSLYESTVKVWIDKNKNGIAEAGEIVSLRDAGVAAINSCYTNKYGMKDSFGNETALRSIMIFQKPMTANEDEIVSFISDKILSSPSSKGLDKRIAIDIILKGLNDR